MVSDSPVSASVRRRWSLLPRRPWPALRPKSVHKVSTSAVTTRRWAPSQSTAGSSPDRRVTDLTPRSCPRSSRFVLGAERSCTARGTHSGGKRAISARRGTGRLLSSGVRGGRLMEPAVFLVALLIFLGIPAFTVIRVARLRAARTESPSADVTARLEALERSVQDLQQELGETQERLDFAERLLSKAREERQIGGP